VPFAPPNRRTPTAEQSCAGIAPIHLICADLAALPFHQSLDGIFSTAAFHWVKDHERLFRSLFLALKPGGWLEAQCGGGPNLARLRKHASVLMSREPYARYFAGWEPPQFYADEVSTAARLRNAGFVDVATSVEPAGFSLGNVPDYRQYLATVTFHQHIARITDAALRERFLDDMTEQALAEKELHLGYWRLNIRGRKPA
jgi:trans-aconitate 2-methyltransferase